MTVETRYFRSDNNSASITCSGSAVVAANLLLTQTGTSGTDSTTRKIASGTVAQFGIQIYKRVADGTFTEITTGSPVAIVERSAVGAGMQSNTWVCPQTSLVSTDRIYIAVYGRVGTDIDFVFRKCFITEALGAQSLDAATWTVYYYTDYSYSPSLGTVTFRFYWDTTTYNSRITNFTWTAAPAAGAAPKIYGDGLIWIVTP